MLTANVGVPEQRSRPKMSPEDNDSKLVQDLEGRIEILENTDDAEFGAFTSLDYVILIIAALIVPALALILAR